MLFRLLVEATLGTIHQKGEIQIHHKKHFALIMTKKFKIHINNFMRTLPNINVIYQMCVNFWLKKKTIQKPGK